MSGEMVVKTTELAPFQRLSIDQCMVYAQNFAASGFFPGVKEAAQAFAKIVCGQELGIEPCQSMTGIHIIDGKMSIGAGILAALVQRSGWLDYRIVTCDDRECVLEWFAHGKSVGHSAFSAEEAKKAQLSGKKTYQSYGSDMYFARALSRGQRRFGPSIVGGSSYVPGEIEPGEVNITPENPTQSINRRPEKGEFRSEHWKQLRIEWVALNAKDKADVNELYINNIGIDLRDDTPETTLDELRRCMDEVQKLKILAAEFEETEPELSFGEQLRKRYHAFNRKDRDKINDKYLELAGPNPEPIQNMWTSGNEAALKFMEEAMDSFNAVAETVVDHTQTVADDSPRAYFDSLTTSERHKISAEYLKNKGPHWPGPGQIWDIASDAPARMAFEKLIDAHWVENVRKDEAKG